MTIIARRFAVGSDKAEVIELRPGMGGQLDDQQVLWIDTGPEAADVKRIDEALGLDGVTNSVSDAPGIGVRFGSGAIRLTVAGLEADQKSGRPSAVLVHIVAAPNAVVSAHDRPVLGIENPVAAVAGDPRFGQLNAGTLRGVAAGRHAEWLLPGAGGHRAWPRQGR